MIVHNMTELPGPTRRRDSRDYPAHVITDYANLDQTKDYPEYWVVNDVNFAPYLIQFCSKTYGFRDEICNTMFGYSNTNQMLFTIVTNIWPLSRGEALLRSKNYIDALIVRTG